VRDFSKIINQLQLIANYVETIKSLSKTTRKKLVMNFTFEQREKDLKSFVYFSILNSGPAGETLVASPVSKQKELKNLFEDGEDISMVFCPIDFYDDKTVIELRCRYPGNKDCVVLFHKDIYNG